MAPDLQCNGFNPEGADLGTLARCATNSYDNNGYLTLDFTCAAAACVVDADCPLVLCHHLSPFCIGGRLSCKHLVLL